MCVTLCVYETMTVCAGGGFLCMCDNVCVCVRGWLSEHVCVTMYVQLCVCGGGGVGLALCDSVCDCVWGGFLCVCVCVQTIPYIKDMEHAFVYA